METNEIEKMIKQVIKIDKDTKGFILSLNEKWFNDLEHLHRMKALLKAIFPSVKFVIIAGAKEIIEV